MERDVIHLKSCCILLVFLLVVVVSFLMGLLVLSLFIYLYITEMSNRYFAHNPTTHPGRRVKTDPCKPPLNVHMCYPPFLLLLWPIYQDILTLVFLHLTWNYCLMKKLLRVRILPEIYCFYIIFIYTNLIHIYLNFYSLSLCFMSLYLIIKWRKRRDPICDVTQARQNAVSQPPPSLFLSCFFYMKLNIFAFLSLSLSRWRNDWWGVFRLAASDGAFRLAAS